MSVIWFKTMSECHRLSPGKWGTGDGYLYGIFFRDGTIKVGSSVNPRLRLMECFRKSTRAKVAVVHIGDNHAERESSFHSAMRPIVLEGYREWCQPTDQGIRELVVKYFETGASGEVLKQIEARVGLIVLGVSEPDFDPTKAPNQFHFIFGDDTLGQLEAISGHESWDNTIAKLIYAEWRRAKKLKLKEAA